MPKEGAGRWQAGRRFASAPLVVVELAIAVVLLVGAGLLGKSLHRLLEVELGFDPERLATLAGRRRRRRLPRTDQRVAFVRGAGPRVAALPGVQSVAVTSVLPVTYNGNTDWIRFVGGRTTASTRR